MVFHGCMGNPCVICNNNVPTIQTFVPIERESEVVTFLPGDRVRAVKDLCKFSESMFVPKGGLGTIILDHGYWVHIKWDNGSGADGPRPEFVELVERVVTNTTNISPRAWICPRCDSVNSPYTVSCPNCSHQFIEATSSGNKTAGCPCRTENGGSGICGCILGNRIIS